MERELIEWLSAQFGDVRNARLGIGDDAAVLPASPADLVFTCDAICDGVHFQSEIHSPELIGRKALAVNLSDLAAMGARQLFATISLAIPGHLNLPWVQRLYRGIHELSDRYSIDICGGDTTIWDGRLVISVAAIGAAPATGSWRIDQARPDDRILVTGRLGGSILGHHMRFEPRCDFANLWRNRNLVQACTDISDSLSLDLAKIARASGTGFEIQAVDIPVADAAHELVVRNQAGSAVNHALFDGEDFELIVIAGAEQAGVLIRETPAETGLTDIGRITRSREYLLCENGKRTTLIPSGYEHRFHDESPPATEKP